MRANPISVVVLVGTVLASQATLASTTIANSTQSGTPKASAVYVSFASREACLLPADSRSSISFSLENVRPTQLGVNEAPRLNAVLSELQVSNIDMSDLKPCSDTSIVEAAQIAPSRSTVASWPALLAVGAGAYLGACRVGTYENFFSTSPGAGNRSLGQALSPEMMAAFDKYFRENFKDAEFMTSEDFVARFSGPLGRASIAAGRAGDKAVEDVANSLITICAPSTWINSGIDSGAATTIDTVGALAYSTIPGIAGLVMYFYRGELPSRRIDR